MRSWLISIILHLIITLAVIWYLYQPHTQYKTIHYESTSHIIEATIVFAPKETTEHNTTQTMPPTVKATDAITNQTTISQPITTHKTTMQNAVRQNKKAEMDQRFRSFSQALNQYLQSLRLKHVNQIEIEFTLNHQGAENIYIKGNIPNYNKQAIRQWILNQTDLQNLPLDHTLKIHQPIIIHHH